MEEWKAIPGYEGIYEASSLGRIRTAEGKTTSSRKDPVRVWKQRILKARLQKRAYSKKYDESLYLYKDGKRKSWLVSRLIALTWCDGYREGLSVNHIDGNTLNNKAENLEWVTFSENMVHSYRTGINKNARPCSIKNEKGEIFHFYSMAEASRHLGKDSHYLSTALRKGTHIYSVNGDRYDFA